VNDRLYDHAARAAAEVTNLHLHDDPCMRFNAVLGVFLKVMRLAAHEQAERILKPSEN
jgi:hypothetical protein